MDKFGSNLFLEVLDPLLFIFHLPGFRFLRSLGDRSFVRVNRKILRARNAPIVPQRRRENRGRCVAAVSETVTMPFFEREIKRDDSLFFARCEISSRNEGSKVEATLNTRRCPRAIPRHVSRIELYKILRRFYFEETRRNDVEFWILTAYSRPAVNCTVVGEKITLWAFGIAAHRCLKFGYVQPNCTSLT